MDIRKTLKHLFSGLLVISVLAGCGDSEELVSIKEEVKQEIAEETEELGEAAVEIAQDIDLAPVTESRPSYEMLQNYAEGLNEYLDRLMKYYEDERIPASRELEKYFADLQKSLDDVKTISANEITEEDCELLIEELKSTESEMDKVLKEMEVTIEDAVTQETADAVNYNYETMITIYNNLVDYFAQDARLMSEAQRAAMIEARRRIDMYDDIYFDGIVKESELLKLNNELVEDINFLNDIAESTK